MIEFLTGDKCVTTARETIDRLKNKRIDKRVLGHRDRAKLEEAQKIVRRHFLKLFGLGSLALATASIGGYAIFKGTGRISAIETEGAIEIPEMSFENFQYQYELPHGLDLSEQEFMKIASQFTQYVQASFSQVQEFIEGERKKSTQIILPNNGLDIYLIYLSSMHPHLEVYLGKNRPRTIEEKVALLNRFLLPFEKAIVMLLSEEGKNIHLQLHTVHIERKIHVSFHGSELQFPIVDLQEMIPEKEVAWFSPQLDSVFFQQNGYREILRELLARIQYPGLEDANSVCDALQENVLVHEATHGLIGETFPKGKQRNLDTVVTVPSLEDPAKTEPISLRSLHELIALGVEIARSPQPKINIGILMNIAALPYQFARKFLLTELLKEDVGAHEKELEEMLAGKVRPRRIGKLSRDLDISEKSLQRIGQRMFRVGWKLLEIAESQL